MTKGEKEVMSVFCDVYILTTFSLSLLQKCEVCRKEFANVYRLQRHMISHDESSVLRRFKCLDCGKAFKFKHHLKVKETFYVYGSYSI